MKTNECVLYILRKFHLQGVEDYTIVNILKVRNLHPPERLRYLAIAALKWLFQS